MLGYFNQQVLASYRAESEKYELKTDSFEGQVTLTRSYSAELERAGDTDRYLDVRFGYRTLETGDLAIVVWRPDIFTASKHLSSWRGFHLEDPCWTRTQDDRFTKWVARYLLGSWDIDNGPKHYIGEAIDTINGLTMEAVGIALYKYRIDSSLAYPAAENNHRYQDAHATLYGYLIDGLSKECLEKIARYLGRNENFQNDKPLKALNRLIPQLAKASAFAAAMSTVLEQRRLASHSVRPSAVHFSAFSTFTRDLGACLAGVHELQSILETLLGMNATAARKRHEAKARLPNMDRPVQRLASVLDAFQMVGKTISKIEVAEREEWSDVHNSEVLVIHFTDESILASDSGSNVKNITSQRNDLRPEDIHIDFRLSWVPLLTKKNAKDDR